MGFGTGSESFQSIGRPDASRPDRMHRHHSANKSEMMALDVDLCAAVNASKNALSSSVKFRRIRRVLVGALFIGANRCTSIGATSPTGSSKLRFIIRSIMGPRLNWKV